MNNKAALLAFALAVLPCILSAQDADAPIDGADAAARTPQMSIELWPAPARALARLMIAKYGTPGRYGGHALYWYDNGPWQRTVVYRDAPAHSFLKRGKDRLEQSVGYQVSAEGLEELKSFDERIGVDTITGALTSRAESEALNYLVLNLAAEILAHTRSVPDARDVYRKTRRLADSGKSSPYLDGLVFELQNDKDVNHWNP